ncbi:MAG: Hsp33 family molecular chaperone HslO [Lachnospiraceae bacterium]|nr:Hsp33 family molecular chaperone HslO [Lachnospiraceae bacterium]
MGDYIVRATAANGSIRAFCATTRQLTEYARACHDTSPVVTAALGRMLTAGAIMGCMQKGEQDVLTLQLRGSGPMKGITVTADSKGRVKGYPIVNDVILPANSKGKLDVSGAIGKGYLSVIKDMGLKDPYVGQVELISGEIAEDLAYYFASSEQVPSAVSLGVLMEKNNTVKQAGGLIIQALPGASDEELTKLEERLSNLPSMTQMLEDTLTCEQILEKVLGDMDLQILDRIDTGFYCNCDRERVEKVIISLGKEELGKIISEGEPLQLKCHFCNKAYDFSAEEIKALGQRLGIK